MSYALRACVISFSSTLLGIGAAVLFRRLGGRARWTALLLAMAALLAFALLLPDGPLVARLVPADDLLAFGQWTPPLAALFFGLSWPLLHGGVRRKCIFVGVGALAVIYASYRPLFQRAPAVVEREVAGCILQSSSSSCGAAATAILLREHGIAATESEMAQLCLTRDSGTTLHGMIRGLRLKAAAAGRRVELTSELSAPCLVQVRLSADLDARDPRYRQQWGWVIGRPHVVVFFGFDDLGARIGDPSVGFEHWSRENLRDLRFGDAVTLVR